MSKFHAIESSSTDEIDEKDNKVVEEIFKKVAHADFIAHYAAKGKDLVLVVGNTGAGKSTFLNYLVGKKMIEAKVPGSMKKGFRCDDPVFEIGFGFESKTHFPQVYYDPESDLTYCDCPGFNDNRGVDFDVSNMYAIARLCQSARSIKGVVILINYYSLETDRAKGLRETLDILRKVFRDPLDQCLSSVQIVVSREKGEVDLSDLRNFLSEGARSLDLPNSLATNAEFYDPLDRYLDKPLSRMPRDGMIAKLQSFKGIDKANVNVVLSSESKLMLLKTLDDLMKSARQQIKDNDFSSASHFFKLLEQFNVLRVSEVDQVLQSFTLFCIQEIKLLSTNDDNLRLLEDLKIKFPSLEDVINQEISGMKIRMEEKRRLKQLLTDAEQDLKVLKEGFRTSEHSHKLALEKFAKDKERLEHEVRSQKEEISRLREESQRARTQVSSPVYIQQQQSWSGGYMNDLDSSFAAMSVGRGSSNRSSYSSQSSAPPGMQLVRGYTRSNGTVVQPYYRKSSR
eukprot:gene13524-14872_t